MNILLVDEIVSNCYDASGNIISNVNESNIGDLYYKYSFDPNTITDKSILLDKKMLYCGNNKMVANLALNNKEMIYMITIEPTSYNNILFKEECKMLLSNDLITWHSYLSETEYIEYVFDDDKLDKDKILRHTLRYNCKPMSYIPMSYKYILILTSSQTMNKLYESTIINGYTLNNSRFDVRIRHNLTENKTTIKNVSKDANNLKVFLLPTNTTVIKDTLEEF